MLISSIISYAYWVVFGDAPWFTFFGYGFHCIFCYLIVFDSLECKLNIEFIVDYRILINIQFAIFHVHSRFKSILINRRQTAME